MLYILAVTSIGVYGIVLAGWASGSTYPLLGGLRSTRPGDLLRDRDGAVVRRGVPLRGHHVDLRASSPPRTDTWYVFLLLPSFLVYVTSMVGETNRAPFDLPEAEGELVGGFHTEYSSLKFAMFMLAEYVNMTTVSALATTLFLGGWHAPWPISMWDGANTGWWPLLWFIAKVWVFLFVFIWLRATLPRLRYDQFMALGWKMLIPVSLVWIMIVGRPAQPAHAGLHRRRRPPCSSPSALLVGAAGRRCCGARCGPGHVRQIPAPPPPTAGGFPVPPLPAATLQPKQGEEPMPKFLDAIAGFGVTFATMFKKPITEEYPEKPGPDRAALPRPPPTQPLSRRAGEVHRLRAVRVGLPGRRHLRRGRGQHRGRTLLARRAVRPGLPDQLPALHRLRAVHRGLPDPGADHDQRLRDGRRQPRRPDLRQGQTARAAAARHGSRRRTRWRRAAPTRTTTGATSPATADATRGRRERR